MSQESTLPQKSGFAKYRSLILLSASFFALVAILSGYTFFMSQKIATATKELELSAQQTVLVQKLSKNLLDLNLYLQEIQLKNEPANLPATTAQTADDTTAEMAEPVQAQAAQTGVSIDVLPQKAIYQLDELKKETIEFTSVFNALKKGGTVQDSTGQSVVITAADSPYLQKVLGNIDTIWTPYLGLLESFQKDFSTGFITRQTSDYLVDYTRLYSNALQAETIDYTSHRNSLIQSSTNQLKIVQIVGISLAFLLFLAIIFGSLRQLSRADMKLAAAQRQTDDIMRTVNEGLFLIDKELIIADQYSGKLEGILQQTDIAGKTLYEVLEGMITQKDMDTTKLFVEQLYNPWVVEELIQDLNPLKQVMLTYADENGLGQTKYLEFNFLRVMGDTEEDIVSVFVSVVDITNEVHLQAQMQKDREQHNRQIEMISYLLNVDGRQFVNFIQETNARLARMNSVLQSKEVGGLGQKARQLYREMHSLKGDASAVKLTGLVGLAEAQEEKLKRLLERSNLKGDDFLPFTVGLDEMVSMMAFIGDLVQRLNLQNASQLSSAPSQPVSNAAQAESIAPEEHEVAFDAPVLQSSSEDNYWQAYFENYAKDIANRQGKHIDIKVVGFDGVVLDKEQQQVYKDISTQLLKNAIVHGVEAPDIRTAKGKKDIGLVVLSLENQEDAKRLRIRDDGAGVNWQKIRQKAVDMGRVSADKASALTSRDLLKLMFSSGISTADKQDEDAGRGVGMDIIKQLANEGRGKIGVNTKANEFTEITVTFPN